MADAVETTGSDSAEKAYAAAAELAIAQADAPKVESGAELQFPAKPERIDALAATDTVVAAPAPKIVIPAELEADLVMKSKAPARKAPVKAVPAKIAKVAKPAPVAAKKTAIAKKPELAVQSTVLTKAAITPAAPPAKTLKPAKALKPAAPTAPKFNTASKSPPAFKEPTMTAKQTKDYTATIKSAAADVQAKARLALAKGNKVLGEASTFTKGNVEAVVTSGKILGTGLKGLGKTYAAEGKSAYATVTADVKELSRVKSPTDFVRLQTSILRRNLDHAFNFGGKNSETVLKLAGNVFAPIAARATLAAQMVKKAA